MKRVVYKVASKQIDGTYKSAMTECIPPSLVITYRIRKRAEASLGEILVFTKLYYAEAFATIQNKRLAPPHKRKNLVVLECITQDRVNKIARVVWLTKKLDKRTALGGMKTYWKHLSERVGGTALHKDLRSYAPNNSHSVKTLIPLKEVFCANTQIEIENQRLKR